MHTQPKVYIINLVPRNIIFVQCIIRFKDAAHQHFHRDFKIKY